MCKSVVVSVTTGRVSRACLWRRVGGLEQNYFGLTNNYLSPFALIVPINLTQCGQEWRPELGGLLIRSATRSVTQSLTGVIQSIWWQRRRRRRRSRIEIGGNERFRRNENYITDHMLLGKGNFRMELGENGFGNDQPVSLGQGSNVSQGVETGGWPFTQLTG